MTDRHDPDAETEPLQRELREVLRQRATVDPEPLERVRSTVGTLPSRRPRLVAVLARAAAVVLALGVGAFALIWLPSGPGIADGPRLQDPSVFAGDPRLAVCPADEAIYAFELAHLVDFRAYYPGENFPADEVPALVVVAGSRVGTGRLGGDYVLAPGHYLVCIAAGDAVAGTSRGPIGVTDADLTALLPAPDMIADPVPYFADPRFERCGGLQGDVIGAFEMAHARDYQRHVPAMGQSPELDVDDPAFVVVFRGVHPFGVTGAPAAGTPTPREPGSRDLCVLVGADVTTAVLGVYPEVDVTGIAVMLDGIAGPSASTRFEPTADPTQRATSSPVATTRSPPAGLPPWAFDLTQQLACVNPTHLIRGEQYEPDGLLSSVPGRADPERALEAFLYDRYVDWLPRRGFARSHEDPQWVRFEYRVAGAAKAIVILSSTRSGDDDGRWRVQYLRACNTVEFDPADELTDGNHTWTDAAGAPLPPEILEERGDCYSGSRMRWEGRLYVRDPRGSAYEPTELLVEYDGAAELPADAVDTGYRDIDRELWVRPDQDSVFVVDPEHVERWPRVRGDEHVRIDCN